MTWQVPRLLLLAVLHVPILSSLADTSPTPASGIEGVILVSPSRPGPLRKDGPSVAPAPEITFDVNKDDSKVASFRTDAEGHFQVSLPPGHYIIVRSDSAGKVGQWRFETDVVSHEVTKVRWTGDSGMR